MDCLVEDGLVEDCLTFIFYFKNYNLALTYLFFLIYTYSQLVYYRPVSEKQDRGKEMKNSKCEFK